MMCLLIIYDFHHIVYSKLNSKGEESQGEMQQQQHACL